MVNFGEVRRVQLATFTIFPPRWCPWDLFRSFKVCSDAKERGDAESSGKLQHLFNRSKTETFVPEFAVENLPLDRTATLVPVFAVKDLLLGRNSDDDDDDNDVDDEHY